MNPSGASRQQGFSLVLAIFILVLLAMLGAALINILSLGSESVARELIATRALFAAESGAQRKLSEIFAGGAVTLAACADTNDGDTDATAYADFDGLLGCNRVDVDCGYLTVDSVNYFSISSTGNCGPVAQPAIRTIEVQAKSE